jgi:hypothetical protein
MTELQLHQCLDWLKPRLLGQYFQNLLIEKNLVALEYFDGIPHWLVVDFSKSDLVLVDSMSSKSRIKRPIEGFVRKHFFESRVTDLTLIQSKGRVFRIDFESKQSPSAESQLNDADISPVYFEFSLIPRRGNFSAIAQGKAVHLNKPQDLQRENQNDSTLPQNAGLIDWPKLFADWQANREQSTQSKTKQKNIAQLNHSEKIETQKNALEKTIKKKEKALAAIEEELQNHRATAAMNWAVEFSSGKLNGPQLKAALAAASIPETTPRGKTVDLLFQWAKKLKAKHAGTEERLALVRSEVNSLKEKLTELESRGEGSGEFSDVPALLPAQLPTKLPIKSQANLPLKRLEKFRKVQVNELSWVVWGKNGQENLELLRLARPWDLWSHLRDYPGAFVVLFRPKGLHPNPNELQKMGEILVHSSFQRKKLQPGEAFQMVLCECRFVRPIKGAKAGLVQYREETPYLYRVPKGNTAT